MPEIPASTQQHLDIEDIKDDLVVLKNGSAALVLQTTAVNFDLLSEVEQDAMIAAFSHLLNSLSFHIQIVIRSKRMDISSYLSALEAIEKAQENPYLKDRIKGYKEYVAELISKNEVLDKRFYIVIPYSEITPMPKTGILGKLLGKKPRVTFNKKALLEKAKIQLEPRKEHTIKQLSRVGIKARQLSSKELLELFYDIYNPEVAREERLRIGAAEYTAPIVEPAIEGRKAT